MSASSPQSVLLAEKLRKRAADCRTAGAVFYDLPPPAQTALYGIAAELDDAVGLVEQYEDLRRTLEQIAGNHGRCDAGHVRIAREALGD